MATAQAELLSLDTIEPVEGLAQIGEALTNWSGLLPRPTPQGYLRYLSEDEGTRAALEEVMRNAFFDWALESSRLDQLTDRHLPSIAGGTIEDWLVQHMGNCVTEENRRALESAKFLRLDRHFGAANPRAAHFYRVKEEPPDMERIITCFGGKWRMMQVAINALQVLRDTWHPGWWPRFERDRSVQHVFVTVFRRNQYVFMRMQWHKRGAGVGNWSIEEEIVDGIHVFTPGEVLAFGAPIGSL